MMSNLWRKIGLLAVAGMYMTASLAGAYPIRTPEGNMPMVHWAVLDATSGNLGAMGEIGARTVAPQTAKESGTYALYGGIDVANPDRMRLLEIYESYEAYRIHSTSEAFQKYRAERFPMLKGLKILEANGIALEQKAEGIATKVIMRHYEVKPEKLAEYQQLATVEAVRSVREEDGVMGMFVTAEHDHPNIIHTMELYRDQKSYATYKSSRECREFEERIKQMFIHAYAVENLPTNIPLSNKGLHISHS